MKGEWHRRVQKTIAAKHRAAGHLVATECKYCDVAVRVDGKIIAYEAESSAKNSVRNVLRNVRHGATVIVLCPDERVVKAVTRKLISSLPADLKSKVSVRVFSELD